MSPSAAESRERGEALLDLGRPADAERELRAALADEPEHPDTLQLLARTLLELHRHDEALETARAAVARAPDDPYGYMLVALAAAAGGDPASGETAIEEAIRLDPLTAPYHLVHAHLLFDQDRYEEAAEVAERARALDPESAEAETLLAACHAQRGRHREARDAAAAALELDPTADHAHAAAGFAALARGDSKEAVARFREALRLDPTDEATRTGLVESLKARNPVYGALIRFFLWQARLPSQAQTAVAFSPLLLVFVMRSTGLTDSPVGVPLIIAVSALLAVSWAAEPIMNLVLLATREGAILLDAESRRTALLFLGFIVAGSGLAVAAVLGAPPTLYILAIGLGAFALGIGSSHHLEPPRRRWMYVGGGVVVACAVVAVMLAAFASTDSAVSPAIAVLLIGILSLWFVRFA